MDYNILEGQTETITVKVLEKDGSGNNQGTDDIPENPGTGSTLLYLAYLTGILALCYTIVCSYKAIKSKN